MRNQYYLERQVLDTHKKVKITEEAFLKLKEAKATLTAALDFEQRYELLIANFVSMELALTEIGLRSTVEFDLDYVNNAKVFQETNRQLANVMTAAKSYTDQVKQDFKHLSCKPSFGASAESELSKQWDESLEFRFMEALRNHTQHHSYPAGGFTSGDLRDGANAWAECVQVTSKKERLFANERFKKKSLEDLPETIDLRFMCREYVRRLGMVHASLRKSVLADVNSARTLLETTMAAYGSDGESTVGLVARCSGDLPETFGVFTVWDDVRKKLADKNHVPPDLWPRARQNEVNAETVKAARTGSGDSVEAAAKRVGVSRQQWERYEAGLLIPFSVYTLYLLLTGQHPGFTLEPRAAADRS